MNHEDLKKYITTNDEWGLSQFNLSDLSAHVTQFTFVAHENRYNEGSMFGGREIPPTNHWTLFLSLDAPDSNSNYSPVVHLEVAPNEPGVPGMLILESIQNKNKNNDYITATTKRVSINPPPLPSTQNPGPTLASILNLLIHKKRDSYIFDPCGEGCRFWFFSIAEDFVRAGFMCEEDARRLGDVIGRYWPFPEGTEGVDRPMARGVFVRLGLGE